MPSKLAALDLGPIAASGDAQGRIFLLHRSDGHLLCRLYQHHQGASVNALKYSDDGLFLAAGFADGHLVVFNAAKLTEPATEDGVSAGTTEKVESVGSSGHPSKFRQSVRRVIMLQRISSRPSQTNSLPGGAYKSQE
jgi:hypothetical protein